MWDRLLVQLKQGTFSLCGQQKQLIIPQYARHILHSIWWMEYMQSGQVGCGVSEYIMAVFKRGWGVQNLSANAAYYSPICQAHLEIRSGGLWSFQLGDTKLMCFDQKSMGLKETAVICELTSSVRYFTSCTSCILSDEWSICNQVSWVVKFSESGVHKNLKYLAPCQFTNYGSFLEAHSFLNLFW